MGATGNLGGAWVGWVWERVVNDWEPGEGASPGSLTVLLLGAAFGMQLLAKSHLVDEASLHSRLLPP